MKCEDIQKELKAFLENDLDGHLKAELLEHLDRCPDCAKDLERQKKLSEILQAWKGIEPSPLLYKELESRIESTESFWGKVFTYTFVKKAAFRFAEVVAIVGLTLIILGVLR